MLLHISIMFYLQEQYSQLCIAGYLIIVFIFDTRYNSIKRYLLSDVLLKSCNLKVYLKSEQKRHYCIDQIQIKWLH